MQHSPRVLVALSMEAAAEGRVTCECGYSGTHAEVRLHLADSPPPRWMPDGSGCWCLADMEPHDGWIHSEWCSGIRRLARRLS